MRGAFSLSTALRWLLMAACTVFAAAPFLVMIAVAFTDDQAAAHGLNRFTLDNFRIAISEAPILRALANGGLICTAITVIQLALALPLAYRLAKMKVRARGLILAGLYLALLTPAYAIAVPRFVGFYELRLLDSYAALILQASASPFAVLLFFNAIRGVPDELIGAARLDGLREIQILWSIVLPEIAPSVATVVILSVTAHWNDLFWPSLVVQDPGLATPPLAVLFFRDQEAGGGYGPLMAAALLVVAPLLLAYLRLQRQVMTSLAGGKAR